MARKQSSFLINEKFFKEIERKLLGKYSIDKDTGCWLWKTKKGVIRNGPGLWLAGECLDGEVRGKNCRAIRAVYLLANPDFQYHDSKQKVFRTCRNIRCVNPDHLDHGSQKSVTSFMQGSNGPSSKLTEPQVIEIKRQLSRSPKEKGLISKLSRIYNVHFSSIANIRDGRSWSHVVDQEELKYRIDKLRE